jgi:hypothetical protein
MFLPQRVQCSNRSRAGGRFQETSRVVSFRQSSKRLMYVAENMNFRQVEDFGVFPSAIRSRYSGLTPHRQLLNIKHPTQPRAASDDEATSFSLLQCLDPISGSAHRCDPPLPHMTVRALIFCFPAPRGEPCSLTQASVFPRFSAHAHGRSASTFYHLQIRFLSRLVFTLQTWAAAP